jgi:hypothetical protein
MIKSTRLVLLYEGYLEIVLQNNYKNVLYTKIYIVLKLFMQAGKQVVVIWSEIRGVGRMAKHLPIELLKSKQLYADADVYLARLSKSSLIKYTRTFRCNTEESNHKICDKVDFMVTINHYVKAVPALAQ